MSITDIQKYKSILLEAHIADGGKVSKREANYVDHSVYREQCEHCTNYINPNRCEIVEGYIEPEGWCKYYTAARVEEKWGTETKVSPSEKGKYKGKSKAELLSAYNALKRSGPHKKGSPAYERMKELGFAVRAKSGWGKVE